MIKKIKKIKKAGIFKDYSWDDSLSEFKQFNVIYGFNGSGKTTLSNIFTAVETGRSEKYPEIEYEVESDTGIVEQGKVLGRKVRVFNQDYISKNVQIIAGKAKPIFILGEENKKIADQINEDELLLLKKEERLKNIREERDSRNRQKDKHFTDIARTISTNISGETTRNYRKPNAETAFQQLTNKHILEELDINKHNLTLRQNELPPLAKIDIQKSIYLGEELEIRDILNNLVNDATGLAIQTVESIIIDRLKQHSDISQWVEEGITLHTKYKSTICEYCNQSIPEQRLKELSNHFNEADKSLKEKIDILSGEFKKLYTIIKNIKTVDKANLYNDLQSDYQWAVQVFEKAKIHLLANIDRLNISLSGKKSKTTESINLNCEIDINPFITAVEQVNGVINSHNTKTDNFKSQKDVARYQLEKHYLSTIYDDVKNLEISINNDDEEIKLLENGNPNNLADVGITALRLRISENKSKISSSHKACDEINKNLNTFLGRDEIVFIVDEEGYVIKRHGVLAENLSEGEKNAIAFVYFTVHLKDQDFDINEGLVVIDDPVSSLDSNSLFQAFAFLRNAVKDAHQVILFTHNFDFLRLLLNWLNYHNLKSKRSLYMLKNHYINGIRNVVINELDKLLQEHESEYHYLFKRLYNFQSDGTIESVYDIPNLARKVLDSFLMFRVPNNKNSYEKLTELKFDENKKTAIYKFTNDQSHITGKGFNPSLVQETQNSVKYLLEMMDKVFPEHYKILTDSINI